jgi:hypothetical protein
MGPLPFQHDDGETGIHEGAESIHQFEEREATGLVGGEGL